MIKKMYVSRSVWAAALCMSIVLLLPLSSSASPATAAVTAAAANESTVLAQADTDVLSLLAQLTLEQKAAQVLMVNIPGSHTLSDAAVAQFKGTVPGAIILFGYNLADTPHGVQGFIRSCTEKLTAVKQVAVKQKDAKQTVPQQLSDHKSGNKGIRFAGERAGENTGCGVAIPPFYALDNEGGTVYRTRKLTDALPAAETVPAQFSVDKAEELYRHIGLQMQQLGITLNLAPVAEVKSEENASVLGSRCFSTEVDTAGLYAAAAVRGMKNAGILSAVKHFPGNGSGDLHTGSAVLPLSLNDLEKNCVASFLPPLAAGADFLLVSHITVPVFSDEPFCFSKQGIAWMRKTLSFSGVVLTDDIAMKALKQNGTTSADNAIRALRAGCDMVMCSEQNIYPVIAAVAAAARHDSTFAARLDEAVVRILTVKQPLIVQQ
ncbi:MAG: glycoside hydrolase family 3 N-terminal domain-containing protein [Treponema sp.]